MELGLLEIWFQITMEFAIWNLDYVILIILLFGVHGWVYKFSDHFVWITRLGWVGFFCFFFLIIILNIFVFLFSLSYYLSL